MIRLTVEEINLLSIYNEGGKQSQLTENMTTLCCRSWTRICAPLRSAPLQKISPLTENEYVGKLVICAR